MGDRIKEIFVRIESMDKEFTRGTTASNIQASGMQVNSMARV